MLNSKKLFNEEEEIIDEELPKLNTPEETPATETTKENEQDTEIEETKDEVEETPKDE